MLNKLFKHYRPVLLMALLVSSASLAYAAQSYKIAAGAESSITEFGICKKVKNNNSAAIFVPTNNTNEWQTFLSKAKSIAVSECYVYLANSVHTDAQCKAANGAMVTVDGKSYCEFAACPTGWTKYKERQPEKHCDSLCDWSGCTISAKGWASSVTVGTCAYKKGVLPFCSSGTCTATKMYACY